jgi:hypothetical protein
MSSLAKNRLGIKIVVFYCYATPNCIWRMNIIWRLAIMMPKLFCLMKLKLGLTVKTGQTLAAIWLPLWAFLAILVSIRNIKY